MADADQMYLVEAAAPALSLSCFCFAAAAVTTVSAVTTTVVVETTDLIPAGSLSCFCYSAAAEITEPHSITVVAAAANFISTRCRLNQGTAIRQFPFLRRQVISASLTCNLHIVSIRTPGSLYT